jgi:CheY-like chemotaxis protein
VIIVSNSSYFSGVVQAAMHAGATHFLNKGECTPQTLLDELRKLETPEQALPPPLPPAAVAQVHETPHQAAEQARAARVLVVDDDRVIHGVLAFFLAEAGFVVQSAFNGRQALEMAEADAPDLMVLDGMMPELDGLEVLKRWQQLPHLCKIPVMMLTAENDAEKKADAIRSGAVDYLTKPFSPDDLVTRAMQLLGK